MPEIKRQFDLYMYMYVSTVYPPIFFKLCVLLDQHLMTCTAKFFRLGHFQLFKWFSHLYLPRHTIGFDTGPPGPTPYPTAPSQGYPPPPPSQGYSPPAEIEFELITSSKHKTQLVSNISW